MKPNVLIPSALVMIAAGFAMACRYLAYVWGVDASRQTPAAERRCAAGGTALLGGYLLFLLAPAALCAWQAQGDLMICTLAGGAYTLVCGMAAYAAVFVGVRCGGVSAPEIARQELGLAASKGMHLLALAAAAPAGALLLREALAALNLAPQMQAADYPVVLGMTAGLCVLPCGRMASRIRCEGEAGALTMGGAGTAALACMALFVWKGTGLFARAQAHMHALKAAYALACALSSLGCALCAGASLKGLLVRESPFRKKKSRAAALLWPLLSLVGVIALALYPAPHMAAAAGAAGGAYALLTLLLCALWLRRVGRGLLF